MGEVGSHSRPSGTQIRDVPDRLWKALEAACFLTSLNCIEQSGRGWGSGMLSRGRPRRRVGIGEAAGMLVRQEGCLQLGPEGTPSLIRSEGLPVNPLITRHQNAQKCTEGPSQEALSLGRYSWTLWAVVPDEQGRSFPSTGLSLPSRARPMAPLLKQGQE